MGGIVLVLMVLTVNQSGDQLTSLIDTDSYWNMRGIAASVDEMEKQLRNPELPKAEDVVVPNGNDYRARQIAEFQKALSKPHAESFNTLIAIKTLANLKDKKAVPILKRLVESKKPFVAEHAKRALAVIQGVRATPASTRADKKQLLKDLQLLPSTSGVAGQMVLEPGDFNLKELAFQTIKRFNVLTTRGEASQESKDRQIQRLNRDIDGISMAMAMVGFNAGNIRVDSVTMGVSSNLCFAGKEQGSISFIVRGKYDSRTASQALGELGVTSAKISGIKSLMMGSHAGFLLPSDDLFVFVAGANRDDVGAALKATATAIATGKGGLAAKSNLVKLLTGVKPGWRMRLAAENNVNYKRFSSVLNGLDTAVMSLTRDAKAKAQEIVIDIAGSEVAAFGASVKSVKDIVGKLQNPNANASYMMRLINARTMELAKSIVVKSKGKKASVTISCKDKDLPGMLVLILAGLAEGDKQRN